MAQNLIEELHENPQLDENRFHMLWDVTLYHFPTCYDQPTTIVPCPRNRSHFKATTDERLLPFLRNFEGAP